MAGTGIDGGGGVRRTRAVVLLAAGALVFLGLLARFFVIQIAQQEHYLRLSNRNRLKAIPIQAARGLVLDRDGEVLVDNKASYSVAAIPLEMRTAGERAVVQRTATLLGLEPDAVLKTVEKRRRRSFEPITLKRNVSFRTLSVLQENLDKYPGIICQVDPRREYVHGTCAAHLLGYIGEMGEAEAGMLKKQGYLYGELIGKTGLEKQYERYLRGEPGVRYMEVNAVGRKIGELGDKYAAPQAGDNLYLSIRLALQRTAEEAFPRYLKGALVAMDPRNGEILAMLSRPAYDPNLFSVVLPESTWSRLNSGTMPLLNRALQGLYPPGSTMKMLTALAGLENGVINRHTLFKPCHGAYRFGTRVFRCWKPSGHGRMDVHEALVNSCDIYFYQMAPQLGLRNWTAFARFFGLAGRTGIDLPGEAECLIPDGAYFDKKYGKGGFTDGQMLNLAIGQGDMLLTPVQLASYTAVLANGGYRVKPHVVRKVVSPRGRTLYEYPVERTEVTAVSPRYYELVRDAMVDVVEHRNGTGKACRLPGVTVAAKTGSAENPHGPTHALFVAFAPAVKPEIVVAVVVENAGHGGSVAAPIARRVLGRYFGTE